MYFSSNIFTVPIPQKMLHKAIIFNLNLIKNCMLSIGKICGDVVYDFLYQTTSNLSEETSVGGCLGTQGETRS